MAKLYATLILCTLSGWIYSQFGWTKLTSTLNPVVTMSSPGIYKGAAWIDVDNDGDIDLFACPNFLFMNDGNGNFTKSPQTFIVPLQYPGGCSFADLDADGDNDLVLAQNPSAVFFNDGLGNFTQINSQFTNFNNYPSWACAIGNATNDKFLEIIFAHATPFHSGTPQPCRYYINTTSFAPFQESNYAFTDTLKPYTVPFWSDYDLDGDMDLFIASGPASGTPAYDVCYQNMKIETGMDSLKRLSTPLFASEKQDGQCYNFIDSDNDGDLDVCITNYISASTRFYENSAGVYIPKTTPFTGVARNLSNCWGDYDNDGDLDVFISRDNTATKMYTNLGNGTFTLSVKSLAVPASVACVSNGDFDNDGDLDLFMNGTTGATGLYRNDSLAANRAWVNIKLTGITSNGSALGAIVKLKSILNGTACWQMREVNAQNTFQGQNDLRIHFGLGDGTIIDSLVVNWPSGLDQVFTNLFVNTFYNLSEGNSPVSFTGLRKEQQAENDFRIFPNPAQEKLTIEVQGFENYSCEIFNIAGLQISQIMNIQGNTTINTEKLERGIYSIKLQSAKASSSKKFVKN